MKTILVHLHLYYTEQTDYFIKKLKNITDCNWDLFVTVTENNPKIIKKILTFKPNAKIVQVNNIGYDVYPFIRVLKTVDLSKYDFVLKLHTKKLLKNKKDFKDPSKTLYLGWRNNLVDALLGSKKIFRENIKTLSDKTVGMIFNSQYLFNLIEHSYAVDIENLEKLKERLNLHTNYQYFAAGTMFIIKSSILIPFANSDFQENEFMSKGSSSSGTLAHAIERVFTLLTDEARLRICTINKIKEISLYQKIKLLEITNFGEHKIITILGIKFKFKSYSLLKNMYQKLKYEYEEYKKQQIIEKQEADKIRGEIYQNPININSDDPRAYTVNWIKENSKVLDVGCACGEFGEKLKELKNAEVTGLEYNTESIKIAKSLNAYKDIIQCDLNKYKNIPLYDEKFDYIVCNDVLEHVYEPQNVINHLKQYLKDDGCFILSIPNIAHASIKSNLLLNNFDYTPFGILDETHIRFFTCKSVIKFLSELNLETEECKLTHSIGITGFQPNNPYLELPENITEFILKDKHSHVVQYVVKCKKSTANNLSEINSEKIQTELEKI